MSALRQSFSWWCFRGKGVDDEALLAGAARIGYEGVELIQEEFWGAATKAGLKIISSEGHGTIDNGLNRRENAARIETELHANIKKAVQWKIPNLICFSGNRDGVDDAAGLKQCAATLSRLAPAAQDAGVTLAVELLNSKVNHKGYQADHTEWGVALCRKVNSPAVRLLYDIYHMQIMEGDVIRTIEQDHEWFSHYHTAGNPGRGEPYGEQEINYPAVYRAIAKTGYSGFIGHEFLPSGDPLDALAKAYRQCLEATA